MAPLYGSFKVFVIHKWFGLVLNKINQIRPTPNQNVVALHFAFFSITRNLFLYVPT